MAIELRGTLMGLQVHGGWARASVRAPKSAPIRAVGSALIGLEEGRHYVLRGRWIDHPKFGKQFEVLDAAVDVVADQLDLNKRIESDFRGVGPKTARAIVAWYGAHGGVEALRSDLANRPWVIERCPGLEGKKITYIDVGIDDPLQFALKRLGAELLGADLADGLHTQIARWAIQRVGNTVLDGPSLLACARQEVASDPFVAVGLVRGYGMGEAERVAQVLGASRVQSGRSVAAVRAALAQALQAGDTLLHRASVPQLVVGWEELAVHSQRAGYDLEWSDSSVTTKDIAQAERVASACAALMLSGDSDPIWGQGVETLNREIGFFEESKGAGFELDAGQRIALERLLSSTKRLHTLTAPPGCGKTAFLEALSFLVRDVVFAAPYSKAAKVLDARIREFGGRCQTLHSLLEAGSGGFRRNRDRQIVARVIVLDEASTTDLPLFAALMAAISPWTHLILVGDVEQLESVGPGRVLADVLDVDADHHKLTHDHRSTSGIRGLVAGIRSGHLLAAPAGDDVKYVFDADAAARTLEIWGACVQRCGFDRVGLLLAYRGKPGDPRGALTVRSLNESIQARVNPDGVRLKGCDTAIRLADRVLIRRPGMCLSLDSGRLVPVANGEAGFATGQTEQGLSVRLDDGWTIRIGWADVALMLDLGYATTVHAAQGSEFDEVVVALPDQVGGFLNRNLLLTAVSRAKRRVWLVGSRGGFEAAARQERRPRSSLLAKKINDRLTELKTAWAHS